jgi:limonene-1,2-epoxide hydrolase
MSDAAANKERVQQFWAALYARDWEAIGSFFDEDSEYTDVPSPPDDIARGPTQVVARLRLGLGTISAYEHDLRLLVAEGDTVVTEHTETWHWHTGEQVTLPFVSVQQLRRGQIVRWWDYWDLSTLMNAAPAWWIEEIAQGYL